MSILRLHRGPTLVAAGLVALALGALLVWRWARDGDTDDGSAWRDVPEEIALVARWHALVRNTTSITPEQHRTALRLVERLTADVHGDIARVQSPAAGCHAAPLFVIDAFLAGFGAQIGFFTNELMTAQRLERVLVIRGGFSYAKGCPYGGRGDDYTCYFRPIGPCTLPDAAFTAAEHDVPGAIPPVGTLIYQRDVAASDRDPRPILSTDGARDFYHDHVDDLANYPPRYRIFGIPFWRTRMTLWLLRLQPEIEALFERAKQQLAWPLMPDTCGAGAAADDDDACRNARVLAIHVRRGDKITEGYAYRPLDAYLAAALRFRRAYGVHRLFFATDSPTVLQEVLASPTWTAAFPHIMVYNDSFRMGDTIETVAHAALSSAQDTVHFGLDALLNVFLISQANFFVGTVHSNLGRLGAELMYARMNLHGPMYFVDYATCRAKGERHNDIEAYATFDRGAFLTAVLRSFRPAALEL